MPLLIFPENSKRVEFQMGGSWNKLIDAPLNPKIATDFSSLISTSELSSISLQVSLWTEGKLLFKDGCCLVLVNKGSPGK